MPSGPSRHGLDAILDDLRPALRSGIADLAESLLGPRNKAESSRAEWRWGNKGGLRVAVTGPRGGACADFETDWMGDPLALIQRARGCNFEAAVLWGAAWAGIDTEGREAKPEDQGARRARKAARERKRAADEVAAEADRKRRTTGAQRLWRQRADTAIDTVSERYVVLTRGIPIKPSAWPDAVGFLPSDGPLVWFGSGGEDVRCSTDCAGALILAATLPDGTVSAVQRVFLSDDGDNIRRSNGSKVKITAGVIAEVGAAARLPGPVDGPVLVAEGPETGLSVWAATGYETHIAIGSLRNIHPPSARRIVICRDDDRATSPADKMLQRIVADWRARGVDFVVATPWHSRRGDKSDFNDVIRSHGASAVRERIEIALTPRTHPPKRMLVTEARPMLDEAVEKFFSAATEWEAAIERVERDSKSRADALIGECLPEEAKALVAAAPVHAIRVDTGLGKSHAARQAVAQHLRHMRGVGDARTVAFAVPTHALGAEQVGLFNALLESAGLRAAVWRGREALDPDSPAQTMCHDLAAVADALAAMVDVQNAVCRRTVNGTAVECPHFSVCGYQRQRAAKADLWFVPHELLFSAKPAAIGELAVIVIDESVWQAGLIDARDIALDALEQDDTVEGDPLASERLHYLRQWFLDAVRDLPDGPIPRSVVEGPGISPGTADEAGLLEWRRRVEPAIYPGMPTAARKEAAMAASGNKTIRRMARLWDAMKALTRPDGPVASGWAAIATAETKEGRVRTIRLKGRREIGNGWAELPTLVLDATLDTVLLRPYWPTVDLTADIRAEAPHQRIRPGDRPDLFKGLSRQGRCTA